jgi:hypothetical protein
MTNQTTSVRIDNTNKNPNSMLLDSKELCRKSLAHAKTYATETVLKVILISLSNVRGTACTIFCEIMMSTLVSLKSL